MNMLMKKSFLERLYLRWKKFWKIILNKKKIKRDSLIFVLLLMALFVFALNLKTDFLKIYRLKTWASDFMTNKEKARDAKSLLEDRVYSQVKTIQESMNTSNWKTYKSNWYGFGVDYPEDWNAPVGQAGGGSTKWEYRFKFRKHLISSEGVKYAGFDMVIYNIVKTKEIFNTDEFPRLRNSSLKDKCSPEKINSIETGDYPVEEIYVPSDDECYESTVFFTFIKGDYIYNIKPIPVGEIREQNDPMIDLTDNFPEFFLIAGKVEVSEIIRPKQKVVGNTANPVAIKQKKIAPNPIDYKRNAAGLRVCAKKNDHPSKSAKDKGKHMDMECCLDPDEYPNPNCHYPSEKYGKYLK